MYIDSHAHLDDERFAVDFEAVLERARLAGVEHIITVGTDLNSTRAALDIAKQSGGYISATAGLHPHDARNLTPDVLRELERLCHEPEIVAVGETGLDYHYDHSPRETQRDAFDTQIQMALRMNLPVVMHIREAWPDALEILSRYRNSGLRGVMHCFSGGAAEAAETLAMGFYVSFAGTVTFRKAEELRTVARLIPLERRMIETDCPWLAPQQHRGHRNEPAFVTEIVACLAALHGLPPETVAQVTTRNAACLFDLPLSEDH